MALKTNCKECGSSTCMDFAMKVYKGNVDISACPYISEEDPATSTDADKLRANDTRYISGGKMFCPNCKNKIEENMNFCPFCGEKIPEKEDAVEVRSVSDITKTNGAFQEEGSELIDLYTQNEDMVCPNCGNDIEEGMTFCPYCDEDISKYEVHIEENLVSDIAATNEPSQEKTIMISAPSASDETSAIFAKGSELVDFYDQNENDVTFQEESLDEPVFLNENEDLVCPNCGNDIEEGMTFCPYCDEEITKYEEHIKENIHSDNSERSGEFQEENLEISSPSNPHETTMTFQEESVEETAHSSPDVTNMVLQNETPKIDVIPAPNVPENIDSKEISEVFTTSDRNKIRATFEKALIAINKIEDALLKQEKFDQEKDALAKKKQEMAEEISGVQVLIVLSIIPVAIILFLICSKLGEGTWDGIAGTISYGSIYCLIAYLIYKFIGIFTSASKEIEADKWYNEQITPLNQKENKFLKEFKDYCESDEFIFVQKIIPEEYFDSESVQYFIKMLKNGRADTYKEVINLYEEHVHRKKMENMQIHGLKLQGENLEETRQLAQNVKAQNEQLQKQTEYMKEISKNTQSTARAVKVNAFIGAVSGHSQSKKLKQIERNTR